MEYPETNAYQVLMDFVFFKNRLKIKKNKLLDSIFHVLSDDKEYVNS